MGIELDSKIILLVFLMIMELTRNSQIVMTVLDGRYFGVKSEKGFNVER